MLNDIALQSWRLQKRLEFPCESGVYMVFADALCIYVGQTSNFKRRFCCHEKAKLFAEHGANYVVFAPCDDSNRKQAEHFLIHTLKPALNRWPAGNWRF